MYELKDALNIIIHKKIDDFKIFLIEFPEAIDYRNSYGFSLLDESITAGFIEGSLLLIEKGINIDNITSRGEHTIHLAVKSGFIDIVKEMININKEIVNVRDSYGNNAVWIALFNARLKPKIYFPIFELLLQNGGDVYNKNEVGRTPLYIIEIATDEIKKEIYELNAKYHFINQ